MRVGREEVSDLLNKWLSESTLLQVDFSFPSFTSCFRGRVFRVLPEELAIVSDDKSAELALRLDPWMEFGYGDSRGGEDAELFEGSLIIFFRLGNAGESPDYISLTEVIPAMAK